ncbi:APC family permease [Streptomyces sp. R39]|uniref:APC family permease n=1 Tax=Streptomyces sp. R39 TaxID=3238631 RepID=A0AB39QML6_9ACTN
MSSVPSTSAPTAHPTPPHGLKRGAIGLGGAVVMSAALMGPAVSVYFNPQLVAAQAGAATPFVFVLSMVASLIVANGIMEMARELPSAGAFYTYVARGVGARTGFVTGGLMFVAYALLVPAELALFGNYTHDLLGQHGVHVPWVVISLLAAALMTLLSVRGIGGSIKVALVMFSCEVAVILVLSVIIVAKGGAHGLSATPLSPSASSKGLSGIALGMVYGVLSFVGFEAAATLGEETHNPRRNVPRGLVFAVVLVGVIYLFCTYAETVGFGTSDAAVAKLASDPAPFTTLGHTYASWMDLLVGLAGISSIFAVTVNSNNGIVRILFAMGREGMLPRRLATVSPRLGTPAFAVYAQSAFAVVVTVVMGFWVGPFNTYAYLGAVLTFGIIPVYWLTNVACMRFFRKQRPEQFKPLRHVVLPVLAIALMVIPVYGSVWPVPAAPYNWFPYAVLGYILLLAAVATVLGRRRPELLARAGEVLAGVEDDA